MHIDAELFRDFEEFEREDFPIRNDDKVVALICAHDIEKFRISSDFLRLKDWDTFFHCEFLYWACFQYLVSSKRLIWIGNDKNNLYVLSRKYIFEHSTCKVWGTKKSYSHLN